jgi:hypothetical protein
MDEPFRIGEPRWRQLDKDRRVVDISSEWGALPQAMEKEVRRGAVAFAKALAEERMRQLEAEMEQLALYQSQALSEPWQSTNPLMSAISACLIAVLRFARAKPMARLISIPLA